MPYRKTARANKTQAADVQFQNKVAQIVSLVGARKTYCELGRGSAKTTDVQCERLIDLIYDMPGAPVVWVADTFANLQSNVLPSVLEGLERKGLHEGTHFVVEKQPPEFTESEKLNLPAWLKPHFWKPFNKLVTYKRTIIFFTGLNIRFGSLDRPSTLAGASYVFVFGDEVKYFKEDRLANVEKANRGYRGEYGNSVFYRGCLYTSDVADPSHIGEYAWMPKRAQSMDLKAVLMVMKAGLVANQALSEYVAAKDKWLKTQKLKDLDDCKSKLNVAGSWRNKWTELRKLPEASTFYIRSSSYVNVDILTPEWFQDAIDGQLPDLNTAILSMKPTVKSGDRFYAALNENHFYFDGIDEDAYDNIAMLESEDCTVLQYCNRALPLELGIDFGNMCSMSVAQHRKENGRDVLRIIKFLYTLPPEYVDELGAKFRRFFAPMQNKVVKMYYDRAGNNYKSINEDLVSRLKRAIERDGSGHPSGFTVHLMSIGQGNIGQPEEYSFMMNLLNEQDQRLPLIRIDAYACKPLKCSLENARTKMKEGVTFKDKSSEKLEVSRLPLESTNPSDSFKYLLMRKEYRDIVKRKSTAVAGNIDIHTV